jgi:predicted Zn-dependent protease
LHQVRYAIAFLEGDTAEMEVQVAWAAGKPGVEDSFLSYQALSHAFFGRLGKAREMFPRAVESARRNDEKEVAGMYKATAAWMEADFGNPVRAREEAIAALTLSSEQSAQTRAAVALASAGDSSRALQLTDELAKRYPLDTLLNGYWLPAIRARVEINRHNPTRAIALLHTASPYERSMPNNPMFAVYLRGQSYLVLRSGGEAAKEFQRILDHRGVVWNGWQGALAHLGLARAYAISGDAAKARAAYQDFLTLWKDADPDIPILVEAKAEYAKLH